MAAHQTSPVELVEAEAGVVEFVTKSGLAAQYSDVLNGLSSSFKDAERISVALVDSPDDEFECGESLVFTIKINLDRKQFWQATDRFYAPLRAAKPEIYPLIAILQDL